MLYSTQSLSQRAVRTSVCLGPRLGRPQFHPRLLVLRIVELSLRTAQITRGSGLAVALGLLTVSHCSNNLVAAVKPTFSRIRTRTFAHVSF